jgi:hypothetical protein
LYEWLLVVSSKTEPIGRYLGLGLQPNLLGSFTKVNYSISINYKNTCDVGPQRIQVKCFLMKPVCGKILDGGKKSDDPPEADGVAID